jgi:isoquinoline 1-oxidoreductase beta subunit
MSRIGKITRRTLLVGSVVVAGGVAFGIYAYKRPHRNPLLANLGEGEAALTPYVRIDQDGVTLITPRADLGQGAYSVQAALLAEELDIAWEEIRVDPGPPSAAYYNGKVVGEGIPIAATSEGFFADGADLLGDVAGKFLGLQVTGGSSTVPDAYEKLRVAGAAARQVLLQAAAQQSGVAQSELMTKDGAVILPDGTPLSYASLAVEAAGIDPLSDVELKDPSKWRYLGKPMMRIDQAAKVRGEPVFGIDLSFPDMVHATVRTNPRLGGAMNGYVANASEAMPGVLKVVEISGGVGVIADNTWRAFRAADAIEFDWGAAPYPATSEEMWDALGASFDEELRDSRFKDDGDVEGALADAEVLEAEYRVPYLAHAPLEPMNAVVKLTDDRLDIWTGTQIPRFVVAAAQELTGLEEETIHLHAQMSGGSFGRRLEDDYIRQAIEVAREHKGVPIKMTWSREEDMTHDFPRPMQMARGRGAVRDGQVVAYDLAIAAPSVTTSQAGRINQSVPGPDVAIVAGAWDQPFRIPHYRVTGYRAAPLVPVSSWRSVGASANGFPHDCFLDELIHAAGADPMEERIRLCWHEPSRRVLETVAEMSGWDGPLGNGKGRGVAFALSFGVPVAEVVEVTQTPQGIRIDKVWVAAEVGRVLDPVNIENQIQGGVVWGLGHAMNCELTYADGRPQQTNYHAFEGMRLYQCPEIEVRALETTDEIRGIGEPAVPPAAPALANAIFAATGERVRALPLKQFTFV